MAALLQLIAFGWFAGVSWLFLQDNAAGRLEGIAGLGWFVVKAIAIAALTLIGGTAVVFVRRLTSDEAG